MRFILLLGALVAGVTLPARAAAQVAGSRDTSAADQATVKAPFVVDTGMVVGREGESFDVPGLIVNAAQRWGLPVDRMLRVAWCESRWDPAARSEAGHAGIFQFTPDTWAWASANAGVAGESPYNPVANVEAASWLMANHGPSHWGCR